MDSTIHDREILSAEHAAELLGVKKQTLYAYASRGALRRVPLGRGRLSGYLRADIERLKARSNARTGHGAVASGALRFGEPVLDSGITSIDARGPVYRGSVAVELAARGATFEQVAELLWTGHLPSSPSAWAPMPAPPKVRALAVLGESAPPLGRLALLLPALALQDAARFGAPREAELARARQLIARLAAGLALPRGKAGGVARMLLAAFGAKKAAEEECRAVDSALVLVADHELNASSFAARVAAGTGADLYACVSAAIATVSGPKHGGECNRVEALVAEARSPARALAVVKARLSSGEALPGFGHPLYPAGDPRAPPLFELGRAHSASRTATLRAVARAAEEILGLRPTVDAGLVALAMSLGLPAGSATGLFALGRSAGWVAHILEQREAGYLLRPRARYIGPRPP